MRGILKDSCFSLANLNVITCISIIMGVKDLLKIGKRLNGGGWIVVVAGFSEHLGRKGVWVG